MQQGADFFRLEGKFTVEGKKEKIVAKVIPGKEKTFERNGVAYERLADHVGLLPVVFLAPDDTALALEGSEERRRFLDNTLCQLDRRYLEQLLTYNRILQSRNAALRQFSEQRTYNQILMDSYNRQLLEPARYIVEKRKQFAAEFQPLFHEFYRLICSDSEQVDLRYQSQLPGNDFAALLEAAAEKDRQLERTTIGTHKDDLVFFMNGLPLKRFASQGQLKSFVLSLKLAQYELLRKDKKHRPLLLLDDLFDKLDDRRVHQLIELLVKGDFGQVFITDTHPERAEEIARQFGGEYRKFTIEKGTSV